MGEAGLGEVLFMIEPDLYTDKIKMIKKNALCVTAWEVLFIDKIEWKDDSTLSKKEKAVIDTIYLREN